MEDGGAPGLDRAGAATAQKKRDNRKTVDGEGEVGTGQGRGPRVGSNQATGAGEGMEEAREAHRTGRKGSATGGETWPSRRAEQIQKAKMRTRQDGENGQGPKGPA